MCLTYSLIFAVFVLIEDTNRRRFFLKIEGIEAEPWLKVQTRILFCIPEGNSVKRRCDSLVDCFSQRFPIIRRS